MGSTTQYSHALPPLDRAVAHLATALLAVLPAARPPEPLLAAGKPQAAFLADEAQGRVRVLLGWLTTLEAAREPSLERLKTFWFDTVSEEAEEAVLGAPTSGEKALERKQLPWWVGGFPDDGAAPAKGKVARAATAEIPEPAEPRPPRRVAHTERELLRCFEQALTSVRLARAALAKLAKGRQRALEHRRVAEAYLADLAGAVRDELADEEQRLERALHLRPAEVAWHWMAMAREAVTDWADSPEAGVPGEAKPWFLGPCPVDFSARPPAAPRRAKT